MLSFNGEVGQIVNPSIELSAGVKAILKVKFITKKFTR